MEPKRNQGSTQVGDMRDKQGQQKNPAKSQEHLTIQATQLWSQRDQNTPNQGCRRIKCKYDKGTIADAASGDGFERSPRHGNPNLAHPSKERRARPLRAGARARGKGVAKPGSGMDTISPCQASIHTELRWRPPYRKARFTKLSDLVVAGAPSLVVGDPGLDSPKIDNKNLTDNKSFTAQGLPTAQRRKYALKP